MMPIDARTRLQQFVDTFRSQRQAALALGISPPFLGDMLKGHRLVSPLVLAQLGLERVTTTTVRAVRKKTA